MNRTFHRQLAVELLVISGIGYAIFRPISFAARWLSESSPIPFPLAIALAIVVAGLPLALMIGFMINGFSWTGPMLQDGFALLYIQVVAIGVGISC